MKLVCFSNNTAGALICNLLNKAYSKIESYKVDSYEHTLLKVGDTPTIQLTTDYSKWNRLVENYKNLDLWLGTHLHPSGIPNLSLFDEILVISTVRRSSKLYRWLRYYYGWYKTNFPNFMETTDLESIDPIRELAKNVFQSYDKFENCINVEFNDIVNGKFISENKLNLEYFELWKKNNFFLYDKKISDWAVKRFDEAEYELESGIPFKYF